MSFDGPWRRFERLIAATDAIASGQLTRNLLDRAQGTVAALALRGFDTSRDPAGKPWRRLARPRARGRPNRGGPLYDSGALRLAASTVRVEGNALVVVVSHPGATTHYYGSRRVPMRRYLPRATLPAPWRAALERDADGLFRALYLK